GADIGAGAGAERYDELHGPRRPVLRLGRRGEHHNEQSQHGSHSPEIPLHDGSPVVTMVRTLTLMLHDGILPCGPPGAPFCISQVASQVAAPWRRVRGWFPPRPEA